MEHLFNVIFFRLEVIGFFCHMCFAVMTLKSFKRQMTKIFSSS